MADLQGDVRRLLITLMTQQLDRLTTLESQQAVSGACGAGTIDDMARLVKERDELLEQLRLVTLERDGLKALVRAQSVEPSGDSGQLAEPESYQWKEGDELIQNGIVRRIIRESDGLLMPENCDGVLPQSGLEKRGYTLHRKASEIQRAEPYQWRVGDEVRRGDKRHTVFSRLADGQIWLSPSVPDYHTQRSLEAAGYTLHRKASEIQPTISDSIGTDGEGHS